MIPTPVRAPNTNAFRERWIRSAREECLDKLLISNQTHLRCVMRDYLTFFTTARPHQGLEQHFLAPRASGQSHRAVLCCPVLGGIIHDSRRCVGGKRVNLRGF
ncbi:integrase core domain-containing protein [Aggregatilinea lenta]|uniref:integrase core domain-containing protein n=1 Tax=Aggregatilinea lenta TaxID=913108 RepID=UPI0013C37AEA